MVSQRAMYLQLTATLLFTAACRPTIEGRASLVDSERVLAVKSMPVEAPADGPVQYEALYVGPDGSGDPKKLDWALCSARKPLAAAGTVAQACFARKGPELVALASDASPKAMLAKDACELFGPAIPAQQVAGQPNGRPADPDTTGGYYQPVRVLLKAAGEPDNYFIGNTRLICGLGGATQDQAADYALRYRPNENPTLASLVVVRSGKDEELQPLAAVASAFKVRRGEVISLRASWARCPLKAKCGDGICSPREDADMASCPADCTMPKGCTGSEPYGYFDPSKRVVVDRRESIRVSWFANDGSFEHDRTGRAEAEADQIDSDNTWTAPEVKGEVLLWVVIRDDRGGVGWESYKIDVQP